MTLLGQAATGTGKAAAFALPVLQRMSGEARGTRPVALVLVPTRELAMQVSQAFHRYDRDLGVRVLPIYGGQPIGRQLRVLERGVDVVVATPGRAIDHIGRGTLRLQDLTATCVIQSGSRWAARLLTDDLQRFRVVPGRKRSDVCGADRREGQRGRVQPGGMTRVYLGVGRSTGIRAQHLVGAGRR